MEEKLSAEKSKPCATLGPDLKAYVDRELSPVARLAVWWHLLRCAKCRKARTAMMEISRRIRTGEPDALDPDLRARILGSVRYAEGGAGEPVRPIKLKRGSRLMLAGGASAAGVLILILAVAPQWRAAFVDSPAGSRRSSSVTSSISSDHRLGSVSGAGAPAVSNRLFGGPPARTRSLPGGSDYGEVKAEKPRTAPGLNVGQAGKEWTSDRAPQTPNSPSDAPSVSRDEPLRFGADNEKTQDATASRNLPAAAPASPKEIQRPRNSRQGTLLSNSRPIGRHMLNGSAPSNTKEAAGRPALSQSASGAVGKVDAAVPSKAAVQVAVPAYTKGKQNAAQSRLKSRRRARTSTQDTNPAAAKPIK